jgi:hypothetical protein
VVALGLWAIFGPVFAYVAAAMAAVIFALMIFKALVSALNGGESPPP